MMVHSLKSVYIWMFYMLRKSLFKMLAEKTMSSIEFGVFVISFRWKFSGKYFRFFIFTNACCNQFKKNAFVLSAIGLRHFRILSDKWKVNAMAKKKRETFWMYYLLRLFALFFNHSKRVKATIERSEQFQTFMNTYILTHIGIYSELQIFCLQFYAAIRLNVKKNEQKENGGKLR